MKQKLRLRSWISGVLILVLATLGISLGPTRSANAETLPTVFVSGTLEEDTTWSAGTVYLVNSTLVVPEGKTLTIQSGTIVKTLNWGIEVAPGGIVDVLGTASGPVIFTSYKDDSAGGDSNNDGNSTGGVDDYYFALQFNGGSGTVDHAVIKGAVYGGVTIACATGSGTTTVTNSVLESKVGISQCPSSRVVVQNNAFAVHNRFPIEIDQGAATAVKLAGSNKNTFSGSNQEVAVRLNWGSIPAGETWEVDPSSGVDVIYSYLGLEVNGNLIIRPGIAVKATGSINPAIMVASGGSALLDGSTTHPIIFTSYHDDSVAGNTDYPVMATPQQGSYGSAFKVEAGGELTGSHIQIKYPWSIAEVLGSLEIQNMIASQTVGAMSFAGGSSSIIQGSLLEDITNTAIEASGEAQLIITDTTISNTSTGMIVGGSATVTFRGSFEDITNKMIQACGWADDCNVDATYTDWGHVDGPFTGNNNSNWRVCGAVQVLPWEYESTTYEGNYAQSMVPNCWGSSNPQESLGVGIAAFQDAVNYKQIQCSDGFQDACQAIQTAMACLAGAVNVASSTSPIPLPAVSETWQIDSFESTLIGSATDKMRDDAIADAITPSSAAAYKGMISSLMGTFFALANAYNSCAPN